MMKKAPVSPSRVTVLGYSPTVNLYTLPPKKPVCMKTAFRQKKSDVVAEMLLMLWDEAPGTYKLDELIDRVWHREVTPLTLVGLDKTLSHREQLKMCVY